MEVLAPSVGRSVAEMIRLIPHSFHNFRSFGEELGAMALTLPAAPILRA
jgi:hypothetical protein